MVQFKRLTLEHVNWEELDRFGDRTVFETLPWLRFLEKTQHAETIVAAIEHSGKIAGYFTGLIVRKYGVKILGSPFRGWSTYYMGFNLLPEYNRREVLKAFPSFAFDQLKCHYFEIADLNFKEDDYADLGYTTKKINSYEIDLTQSEEELFARMKSTCRWSIRKAEKNGVYIEESRDMGFVDDYYDQLIDVFAKQSLVPRFSRSRVKELIANLLPSGNLLLLRARREDGLGIATGIFPAFNDRMFSWGLASRREDQRLRPNELLLWYAMRYWKAKGMKKLDMCGQDEYKRKYGVYKITVPILIMGKYEILFKLRDLAVEMVRARRDIWGYLKR